MATSPRSTSTRNVRADQPSKVSGRAARKLAAERAARRRRLLVVGGAVGLALVLALVLILVNLPDDSDAPLPAVAVAAEPYPGVPTEGRSLGDPNAPVTVIEFGDYQCPGCGQFAQAVEPRLVEEYVATGLVRFEFRDYSFLDDRVDGSESDDAAEAAFCAADQGQFWRFHATLYANQYGENQGAFDRDRLGAMAEGIGLDTARFDACLNDGAHADGVAAMNDEAAALGLGGTPSFVVNGTVIDYSGYDSLKAAIDAELAATGGAG
jgi:protein-disulfide isomerase